MLAWGGFALICSCLISVNINRVNFLWLPVCYFAALGLDWIVGSAQRAWPLVPAALFVCFALFLHSYGESLGGDGNVNFFPGLGEAVEYVDSFEPESAYISTNYVNSPYIFALFYTQTPPGEFIETVEYANPGAAFQSVDGFGYWRFGPGSEAVGEYVILHAAECAGRDIAAVFGQYAVCTGN